MTVLQSYSASYLPSRSSVYCLLLTIYYLGVFLYGYAAPLLEIKTSRTADKGQTRRRSHLIYDGLVR